MAKLRKCHQSHDRDEPKPDRADLLKPDQLSLNSCKATLGRVPISGILGHRKFSDKLTINQPAALPEVVEVLGLVNSHASLHHEGIILICPPLLMKHGDVMVATIRNDIPNPPSLYGPGPTAAFPSRYQPIRERTVGWQSQRPDCRFIGNEFDYSRDFLEMLPSLVKIRLVLGGHANPHIRVPSAPV